MTTSAEDPQAVSQPGFRRLLVAVDCSDHSNAATEHAVALARAWGAEITGLHAYAAGLHDRRFRQMEAGLPERYREEAVLEQQRGIHESLIHRGLALISDSYLDQAERACQREGVHFSRLGLEGRNYRVVLEEAASGRHDLLVIGAQGLGAVHADVIGTVCERVVRRTPIDALVVKDLERRIGDGPILVALDGSPHSFGSLLTGIELGQSLGAPVHVIAVFDPYFHYVAFERIAAVLSKQAGKVFRFREQEKLHEEIIDGGLAKIYSAHLRIAESIAEQLGAEVRTELKDGKAYDAILKHVEKIRPSLLMLGKIGIHGGDDLEIGGTTQHLLRLARCNLWIGGRRHVPDVHTMAEQTIAWTKEADRRMERVPAFVRSMARMAILQFAQERGHTVVTESIVEQATAELMPAHAEQAMQEILAAADQGSLEQVAGPPGARLPWTGEATCRLERVPEGFMRDASRERIERMARREGRARVELELAERALADSRCAMAAAQGASATDLPAEQERKLPWDRDAESQLDRVPVGFMRTLTAQRIEARAQRLGHQRITREVVEAQFAHWKGHSEAVRRTLVWDAEAYGMIAAVPAVVRGMIIREVEAGARREGLQEVSADYLRAARGSWEATGRFHVAPTGRS